MKELIKRMKPKDAFRIINPQTSEKALLKYQNKEEAAEHALNIIRELVEEATPKRPTVFKEEWGIETCCPRCGEPVNQDEDSWRCKNCDQILDWDDGNDDF